MIDRIPIVTDDPFGDSLEGAPSLEGGQDAESIVVKQLVNSVALPFETIDWLLFAGEYCKEKNFGRSLAERYIELYQMSSTGRFNRMVQIVEALSLRKLMEKMQLGGFGGSFGGK